MTEEIYDLLPAAACVRGLDGKAGTVGLPRQLAETPLEKLTEVELVRIVDLGLKAGCRLHYFKKKEPLLRVSAVLGFLRALDLLSRRIELLEAVSRGGIERLTPLCQDLCAWDAPEGAFDVVTLLEVLEHIPAVDRAVEAAVHLARRYVVVTVPSKPDNNPEHIHLLTKEKLTGLFTRAGCGRLQFGGVNGLIAARGPEKRKDV